MRRGYLLALLASVLVGLLYGIAQPSWRYDLSNTAEVTFSLIPLLVAVLSLRRSRRDCRWFGSVDSFLLLGFLFWFLGEFTWSFYALVLRVAIPFPSLADVFWLAGYPFLLLGMVSFVSPFRTAITQGHLLRALIVSVVAVGLIVSSIVVPVFSLSTDLVGNAVSLAYPLLDIALLFAGLVGLLLFWGGKVARGWYWLTAGAILNAVADMMFAYLTAAGAYYDGHPLELLYALGYVCFALAVYESFGGMLQ